MTSVRIQELELGTAQPKRVAFICEKLLCFRVLPCPTMKTTVILFPIGNISRQLATRKETLHFILLIFAHIQPFVNISGKISKFLTPRPILYSKICFTISYTKDFWFKSNVLSPEKIAEFQYSQFSAIVMVRF